MRHCVSVLATLFVFTLPSFALADRAKPNVVVILADDLGYGDVQARNPKSTIPTPHLNQLASEGMTFTDAHSPSAVCTPTRYGLMTGRYCWRSKLKRGVLGGYSEPLIEPGRPTIADRLSDAGYSTGAIGKWHLGMSLPMLKQSNRNEEKQGNGWAGDPGVDFAGKITNGPTHHGFDMYYGVTASLDMPPYVWVRDDGFTQLPSIQQPAVKFPHFVRKGPRSKDFIISDVLDRLTEEAVTYIKKNAAKEQPYFLYMPLTGPHKPTQPHARFRGKTELGEYGDFVHQVDWTVGQVLEAIESTGESDNTIVFFTSDNGSYMYRYDEDEKPDHTDNETIQGFRAENHAANAWLRGTKADVWEGGHRVPTFVRWPGKVAAGSLSNATVCHVDIYATIADIAGIKLSKDEAEDSLSWTSIISGDLNHRGAPVINHSASGMFAIRDGAWKLVAGNGSGGRQQPKGKPFAGPFELYDLEADIAETTNVAKEHPEVVKQLTAKLEQIRSSGRSRPINK